jgi:hypothetical protein
VFTKHKNDENILHKYKPKNACVSLIMFMEKYLVTSRIVLPGYCGNKILYGGT